MSTLPPFGAPRQVPSPVPTITFTGASGRKYAFAVYELGQFFHAVPGVYALCKETTPRVLNMRYVGEAEDFDARIGEGFPTHHKWAAAILDGVTHVCVYVVRGGKRARCSVETDLRHNYFPPLNDQ